GRKLHLPRRHKPDAAYGLRPRRRSARPGQKPASKILHYQKHPMAQKLSMTKNLHNQKPSSTLLTRVRANSRERRSSAGESSSKKLESSRETWYSSRNR